MDETSMTGFAHRDLVYQGLTIGRIHAAFDVSHLFAERREILMTLLVTNGTLAALFSPEASCSSADDPAERVLESHMRKAVSGSAEPIPPGQFSSRDREVASLFRGYNALVKAERERADLAMRSPRRKRWPVSDGWPRGWLTRSTILWAGSSTPSTR